VRSDFSERLLLPLEITQGRFQKSHGILEPPEALVAVIAKQATEAPRLVVMIKRQPARLAAVAPVSVAHPANRASAILAVQKGLVRLAVPAGVTLLVGSGAAGPALDCPLNEARKLVAEFPLPARLANDQTVADTAMGDPMQA